MKIGFVASCFDLLHAGHCLMLKDSKEQCDWLVAALQDNPSIDKPVQTLEERKIQLESIRYVDEIALYNTEEDLIKVLELIKPHIRILGSDYENKDFTGKELKIPIYYHLRDHEWSTSSLREKIKNAHK